MIESGPCHSSIITVLFYMSDEQPSDNIPPAHIPVSWNRTLVSVLRMLAVSRVAILGPDTTLIWPCECGKLEWWASAVRYSSCWGVIHPGQMERMKRCTKGEKYGIKKVYKFTGSNPSRCKNDDEDLKKRKEKEVNSRICFGLSLPLSPITSLPFRSLCDTFLFLVWLYRCL